VFKFPRVIPHAGFADLTQRTQKKFKARAEIAGHKNVSCRFNGLACRAALRAAAAAAHPRGLARFPAF
jgi:hypothetical protein